MQEAFNVKVDEEEIECKNKEEQEDKEDSEKDNIDSRLQWTDSVIITVEEKKAKRFMPKYSTFLLLKVTSLK